ncbi:hypothetical protein niasHT_005288 [Heterodera trifolii]|uniref:Uncharacterized protein n=1 Tax=Heterodera trifolii TaxID=157864 RepID=A0ABD2M0I7_9BILA
MFDIAAEKWELVFCAAETAKGEERRREREGNGRKTHGKRNQSKAKGEKPNKAKGRDDERSRAKQKHLAATVRSFDHISNNW